MKKKKLNKKTRSAIRKAKIAAGTYVAPAKPVATKKKVVSTTGRLKSKSPASGTAAVPHLLPQREHIRTPEFAVIVRRPTFVPQRNYWTGGTVVPRITHLKVPPGFVLSTDPSPGPDFRIAHMKVLRTAPDGLTVKLVRWVMREDVQAELSRRAAAVLAEIGEDERRDERNKLAVQRLFLRVCGRERTNR